MAELETFGGRMRRLRDNRGWRLVDLCARLGGGYGASRLSQWELGHNYPRLEDVGRLAEIFECSTDYLLRGKNDPAGRHSRMLDHITALHRAILGEKSRETLVSIVKRFD